MNPIKPNKRINWETKLKPEEWNSEKIKESFGLNQYHEYLENTLKAAQDEIRIISEQLVFNDIIEIYKGRYKDYQEYYEALVEYNSKCREHNTPKFDKNSYIMTYMFEKRVLLKRQFDYIRGLNPITYNEKGKK